MYNFKTGWLSPEGKIFECEHYDHTTEARNIIENYLYISFPTLNERHADDYLIKRGWCHLTKDLRTQKYKIYTRRDYTENQKQYLKPIIEDNLWRFSDYDLYYLKKELDIE